MGRKMKLKQNEEWNYEIAAGVEGLLDEIYAAIDRIEGTRPHRFFTNEHIETSPREALKAAKDLRDEIDYFLDALGEGL